MRDALGFAPPELQAAMPTRHTPLGPVLAAVALLAAAAWYTIPRGLEAQTLLSIEDDPAAIAERALDAKFDAALAQREIEEALAAKDADLAQSFVELSAARNVALDPDLKSKVGIAVAEANSTRHAAESFAYGLVTGEPSDVAGLAGTTLGDLFVFGDIRDAVREGSRLASGQQADELVLGLAAVGLAVTAGTYATAAAGAPVRAGLSIAKAARKTGKLSGELATYVGRSLRGVVDWGQLKGAAASLSIAQPAVAVRAARGAVKVERASELMHLARDVGRVRAKAGTKAAFDGLKIAETPREMARVAKLAEKQGGKTRAILKTVGRGAIALSLAALDLGAWILGALFSLLAFIASLKSATERMTQRFIDQGKRRRLMKFAALTMPA